MKITHHGMIILVIGFLFLFNVSGGAKEQPASGTNIPRTVLVLNRPAFVDFIVNKDRLQPFTQQEQLDQIRDWLLYSALYGFNVPEATITKATFDLPAFRSGYMDSVAAYEYGTVRSCYVGNKTIVALLPAGLDEATRSDYLAHIIDRHKKNLGETPSAINLLDYTIDLADCSAYLTARGTLKTAELFTQAYGYYEVSVKSKEDIARFMSEIDDVVSAQIKGASLVLGGRKFKSRSYRGIRVEDIAAIWQGEKQIYDDIDSTQKSYEKLADDFNMKWQAREKALSLKSIRLKEQFDKEKASLEEKFFLGGILENGVLTSADEAIEKFNSKWEEKNAALEQEYADLKTGYDAAEKQFQYDLSLNYRNVNLTGGLGFSLDPVYDYDGLAKAFNESEFQNKLANLNTGYPAVIGKTEIKDTGKALLEKDILPFLKLKDKLENPEILFGYYGSLLDDLEKRNQFQAARYDGNLKGTEVGMVLFYTDLLAKLWTIDYLNSSPDKAVPGFVKDTAVPLSVIYKDELKTLPAVRIWFGPADSGFQLSADKQTLLLSRNATRIYAASSNPLQPGVEAEVSAAAGAAINWWDQHFEEVAQYEPEYERLNQVMKWSLITSWLFENKKEGCLSILKDFPVTRTYSFPDWVKQKDLRFDQWDKIVFFANGYKGAAAEVLPLLTSYSFEMLGDSYSLSGGVSLASQKIFKERKPLVMAVDDLIRRSNIDYAATADKQFTTLDKQLIKLDKNTASIQVNDKTKLRTKFNEHRWSAYKKRVYYETDSVSFVEEFSSHSFARLQITGSDSTLTVRFLEKDMSKGESLIRFLSQAEDPLKFLSEEERGAVAFNCGDYFYCNLYGTASWVKAVQAAKIKTDILSASLPARGAAVGAKTPYYWDIVDNKAVDALLGKEPITLIKSTPGFDRYYLRKKEKGAKLLPGKAVEELDKSLKVSDLSRLNRIDELLIGNKDTASFEIEDSIEQSGSILDLQVRKAAAQIKRGKIEGININDVPLRPLRDPEATLNFIDTLADTGEQNTRYVQEMKLLKVFTQWKDREIRDNSNQTGAAMLIAHDRNLVIAYRFKEMFTRSKINPNVCKPDFLKNSLLYSTDINKLGSNLSLPVFQQLFDEGKIVFFSLKSNSGVFNETALKEIALNQPTVVYAGDYTFKLQSADLALDNFTDIYFVIVK